MKYLNRLLLTILALTTLSAYGWTDAQKKKLTDECISNSKQNPSTTEAFKIKGKDYCECMTEKNTAKFNYEDYWDTEKSMNNIDTMMAFNKQCICKLGTLDAQQKKMMCN